MTLEPAHLQLVGHYVSLDVEYRYSAGEHDEPARSQLLSACLAGSLVMQDTAKTAMLVLHRGADLLPHLTARQVDQLEEMLAAIPESTT